MRFRIPNEYRDLAVHVTRYHLLFHRAQELKANTILKLLKNLDALRRPDRFEKFLLACEADAKGRLGLENQPCPQARLLQRALEAAQSVGSNTLIERGFKGAALGHELQHQRILAIKAALPHQQE